VGLNPREVSLRVHAQVVEVVFYFEMDRDVVITLIETDGISSFEQVLGHKINSDYEGDYQGDLTIYPEMKRDLGPKP